MPIPLPSPAPTTTVTLGDWTGTIGALAFGAGTNYETAGVTGWRSIVTAPVGAGMSPHQTGNGAWSTAYYAPTRQFTIHLNIVASVSAFAGAVDALEAATQPSGAGFISVMLQVDGAQTTMQAKLLSRDVPTDLEYQFGLSRATLTFEAPDPRRFGPVVSAVAQLPVSTGGMIFPITFPLTIATTQVLGQAVLTNPGTATGPVKLRVDGPVTAPSIKHLESGLVLGFAAGFSVVAGDFLLIDCEARTVLANGQSSRSRSLISRGWPGLLRGTNTFAFNASSYSSTAQLTVTGTPSWI